MKGNDGSLAFFGFQELERFFAIHKPVLREYGGTERVPEDVEVGLQVGVAVCIVLSDVMAGQLMGCSRVEVIGKDITCCLPP